MILLSIHKHDIIKIANIICNNNHNNNKILNTNLIVIFYMKCFKAIIYTILNHKYDIRFTPLVFFIHAFIMHFHY
jgi:hypothetical protein